MSSTTVIAPNRKNRMPAISLKCSAKWCPTTSISGPPIMKIVQPDHTRYEGRRGLIDPYRVFEGYGKVSQQ